MRILHLTQLAAWQAALSTTGHYTISTHGATLHDVGFLHAATDEQLPDVAQARRSQYGGSPEAEEELVVLVMEDGLIETDGVEVRWEDGGNGTEFPHIYGPLKPEYVTAVLPARFDAGGRFSYGD